MSLGHSPQIVMNGLQIYLDAGNTKSYNGAVNTATWNDMVSGNLFNSTNAGMILPTYTTTTTNAGTSVGCFRFVGTGTNDTEFVCASPTIATSTQQTYTRIAWFKLSAYDSGWSSLFQNAHGNNADMALTVYYNSGSPVLSFHQLYNGNDYYENGTTIINTNTWYMGAMTVNLLSSQVSLYVNGKLDATVSFASLPIGNSQQNVLQIGGATNDGYVGGRMMNGYIGAVMHYNRTLSADEIQQNFSALRGRFGL